VELGAETPAKNPYFAEMYKLVLQAKLYSRTIPRLLVRNQLPFYYYRSAQGDDIYTTMNNPAGRRGHSWTGVVDQLLSHIYIEGKL